MDIVKVVWFVIEVTVVILRFEDWLSVRNVDVVAFRRGAAAVRQVSWL